MSSLSDEMSLKINVILVLALVGIALGIANLVVSTKADHTRERWYNGEELHTARSNRACACPGYGFKTQKTMPFNDDSNLYVRITPPADSCDQCASSDPCDQCASSDPCPQCASSSSSASDSCDQCQ